MTLDPRPPVSVVVPFYGDTARARAMIATMETVRLAPGDELVISDNTPDGVVGLATHAPVRVVTARREQSPAHARNEGSSAARGEWLWFVDADCTPQPDILERFFQPPPDESCGALAGEIEAREARTLVGRYAGFREHLSQRAHVEDRYKPRAATANLLVRRAAWEDVGGFAEGARTAEDADFCFRLQDAGWTLGYRAAASVAHEHRDALRPLLRQRWSYAAGSAWLQRRHPGSIPFPRVGRTLAAWIPGFGYFLLTRRPERAAYKLIDLAAIACDVLGRADHNRPQPGPAARQTRAASAAGPVAVVGRTADRGKPDAGPATVEAAGRPLRLDREALGRLCVRWAEDDGAVERARALAWLLCRRPAIVLADLRRCEGGATPLPALAPVAHRLAARRGGLIRHDAARATDARRLAAMLGPSFRIEPLEA